MGRGLLLGLPLLQTKRHGHEKNVLHQTDIFEDRTRKQNTESRASDAFNIASLSLCSGYTPLYSYKHIEKPSRYLFQPSSSTSKVQ